MIGGVICAIRTNVTKVFNKKDIGQGARSAEMFNIFFIVTLQFFNEYGITMLLHARKPVGKRAKEND
jgi:hypothetical protein